MSVLIKGMEMPTNCWFCSVKSWDDGEYVCPFSGRTVKSGDVNRHEDCPLIELPDHGDLIDRDELMMKMWEASAYAPNHCSWVNARVVFARDIEDAPVVIPAERSEESICDNCDERSDVGCSWCRRMERSEDEAD